MKLCPEGWFTPPSKSFHIFSGNIHSNKVSPDRTDAPDFDEIVHVDGKKVVWSSRSGSGQSVSKSYRQVLSAKQALLCSFTGVGGSDNVGSLGVTGDSEMGDQIQESEESGKDQSDTRCLCVLQGLMECVKIYAPDGAEFEVALPCKAARMWSLPRGILIERAVNTTKSSEDDSLLSPMFFSLLHPLEELKPVSYIDNKPSIEISIQAIGSSSKNEFLLEEESDESSEFVPDAYGEFMCDTNEQILFVDNELCLVVSYNQRTKKHSIWSLLPGTAVNTVSRAPTPRSTSEGFVDDDDIIESEVFMQMVWNEKEPGSIADNAFVSHDLEGRPLVCLVHTAGRNMKVLRVSNETRNQAFNSPTTGSLLATPLPSLVRSAPQIRVVISECFEMDVLSAQPIVGTKAGPLRDMIVLTLDHKLALYRGSIFLSHLELSNIHSLPSIIRESDTAFPSSTMQVVRLEYPVSNRVNLVFDDGRSLRVCTNMTFHSPLVRPVIAGIDSALPASTALRLSADVATLVDFIRHSDEPCVKEILSMLVGEEGLARTGTKIDLEWGALIILIAQLLLDSGNSEKHIQEDTKEPISYFDRMLKTDYHLEYNQMSASILGSLGRKNSGCPIPSKNWLIVLASIKGQVPLVSIPEDFVKSCGVLIFALHLVYEEFKLSTLTWPLTRPLVGLLYSLVDNLVEPEFKNSYLDHYTRDFGVIDPIPLPVLLSSKRLKLSSHSPPDIHLWFSHRLKMQPNSSSNSSSSLSPSAALFRPFPELETCFRTQQLCCFFELLSGSTGDEGTVSPLEFRLNKQNKGKQSPAKSPVVLSIVALDSTFAHWMSVHGYEATSNYERTVLGMVWFGFTLADLETVTFGLSIPLREALRECRSNPSGRWPADAYVLVGREDMAALALAPPVAPQNWEPKGDTDPASPVFKTPIRASYQQGSLDVSLASVRSGASAFPPESALKRSLRQQVRPSDSAWTNLVTTAVTPVWRRLSNGHQDSAFLVADDILWGGEASHRPDFDGRNTFLHKQQQNAHNSTGATTRLLSIADFARLSASASAEVGSLKTGDVNENGLNTSDPSGFELLTRMTSLRFGRDRRILEVCRLLRSSSSVKLLVEKGPEVSDHDLGLAQQSKLLLISRRTMSLSVGRGMATLGTVRPLLTDTVEIPPLVLAGTIPPNNAVMNLDLNSLHLHDDMLHWPQFHNGAAAGLRLSAGKSVTPLTRTWIAYNRPESPNFTHAGFLLALGLHGHLAALTMADIYEYLAQGHDATTVAIMLGLSAAKRGSMAPTISKMLCLHIPSLLPAAFSDMEVPSVVQTSALMGVGLLYEGTGHRLMTEFLLAEIGRRPNTDKVEDRESYSLAAGLSLGLVTLGYGAREGGLSGLSDLRLEDRLHRYMIGGLDNSHNNQGNDPNRCSRLKEGPYVNVNVTSPGATLALGFTFIKSNNESVATRLAIPDTHFLLDYVRPDLLMLRVIARSLVLWDAVEATEEWILDQVPPAIRFSYDRLAGGGTAAAAVQAASHQRKPSSDGPPDDDSDYEFQEVDSEGLMDDDEEGASEAAMPQPPPHPNMRAMKRRGNSMNSMISRVTSVGEDSDGKPRRNTGVPVDEQSVKQAHANIVAGACFAIGLRFVGTATMQARNVLMHFVGHFIDLRNAAASQKPDPSTIEMCLGTSAIALALVMAGTGDLATLRLLRSLRFKTEEGVTYGNHMAIASAIGILFLGGGRVSFSNDNSSIAALVCAFYPRFPMNTNDNQYHLQAMRHLYVLATEQRCIDAYDIDTRSPCYLPIKVILRPNALQYYNDKVSQGIYSAKSSSTVIDMVAPCLLPPLSWVTSIESASPRYWDLKVHLDGNVAQRNALWAYRVLCVKRKVGHLSYLEDPQGVSSLLARPRPKLFRNNNNADFMRAYTGDPHVLAFSKYFCSTSDSPEEEELVTFATDTLYECLAHEKPEMLSCMIELYDTGKAIGTSPYTFRARNLQLLYLYYSSHNVKSPLVQRTFLESLRGTFLSQICPLDNNPQLLKYYLVNRFFPSVEALERTLVLSETDREFKRLFATYLIIYAIPDAHTLKQIGDMNEFTHDNLPNLVRRFPGIPPLTILKMVRSMSSC